MGPWDQPAITDLDLLAAQVGDHLEAQLRVVALRSYAIGILHGGDLVGRQQRQHAFNGRTETAIEVSDQNPNRFRATAADSVGGDAGVAYKLFDSKFMVTRISTRAHHSQQLEVRKGPTPGKPLCTYYSLKGRQPHDRHTSFLATYRGLDRQPVGRICSNLRKATRGDHVVLVHAGEGAMCTERHQRGQGDELELVANCRNDMVLNLSQAMKPDLSGADESISIPLTPTSVTLRAAVRRRTTSSITETKSEPGSDARTSTGLGVPKVWEMRATEGWTSLDVIRER